MRYRVRVIDSFDYPKIYSIYKLSWRTTLAIKENSLDFEFLEKEIQFENINSVSTEIKSNTRWIHIEYNSSNKAKHLFFVPTQFLGIFPDYKYFDKILSTLSQDI